MVKKVIVLGGGSAGFLSALALKAKMPDLSVLLVRSKDIGIIGVGEGSTVGLTAFLHDYLRIGEKKFFQVAEPTWKLGLKFLWGPRPSFNYTFVPDQVTGRVNGLRRPKAYHCEPEMSYEDVASALMSHDRIFERLPDGRPRLHRQLAYHFENEKFVRFLEGHAVAAGVVIRDDTVLEVRQGEAGVAGLVLESGTTETADLYVDASGFRSELLGKALGEPFVDFGSSLFCERAVVGGWGRGADEPIKPYTTCETMDAGWCWQIEHETRVNRGYVYSSAFITDEAAEAEFRAKNPKVGPTRVVRFVSGRYRDLWVKNVVAIGNAGGFVEPLEATALGVIAIQSVVLCDSLVDSGREVLSSQRAQYNRHVGRFWDNIRAFLAVHYRFNTRLDTAFWRHCREHTDLAGAADLVDVYRDHGPSPFWEPTLVDSADQFRMNGYLALLVGQRVPYRQPYVPTDQESKTWNALRQRHREAAARAITVREALDAVHSPRWQWPT